MDRREFLRTSTLLGLSAASAYAIAGIGLAPSARADDMPTGGTIRVGHRVSDVSAAHALNWFMFSNMTFPVVQTLTRTGTDNVTRPHLCASWEPSEDLRTWTIHLRPEAKWHSGRPFTADDVICNLQHLLDPATGSSSYGLMKAYLLNETQEGDQVTAEFWDANALEKVDDFTIPQSEGKMKFLFLFIISILIFQNNLSFAQTNNNAYVLFNESSQLYVYDGQPLTTDANQNGFKYFNSSASNKQITVQAWVYLIGDTPADVEIPVIYRTVNNGNTFSIYLKNNRAYFSVGNHNTMTVSTNLLPAFQWLAITGTYDGSNLKIYSGGSLVANVAFTMLDTRLHQH